MLMGASPEQRVPLFKGLLLALLVSVAAAFAVVDVVWQMRAAEHQTQRQELLERTSAALAGQTTRSVPLGAVALMGLSELLEGVADGFQLVDDTEQFEDVQHLGGLAGQQVSPQAAVLTLGLVLQAVDLHDILPDALAVPQRGQDEHRQLSHPGDHVDLGGAAAWEMVDLIDVDQVHGPVHMVHAIVEPGRERVNVSAIEGGDESRIDPVHDQVCGLIGLVLDVAHARHEMRAAVRIGGEQPRQQPGTLGEVRGTGHEEFGEGVIVAGGQPEEHRAHSRGRTDRCPVIVELSRRPGRYLTDGCLRSSRVAIMAPDHDVPGADLDPLQSESALLSGVRSAISNAHGDLDQSAIDAALGVTPLASDGGEASTLTAAPDITN